MLRKSIERNRPRFTASSVYSVLNVLGLNVGFVLFLAIAVYVANEFRYDRYHQHAKEARLYSITFRLIESRGTDMRGALTPPPMASVIQQEFPEMVEAIARCRRKDTDVHYGSPIVQSPTLAESEPRFYWVDPTFFDVFTVRFREGDPKTALLKADTIVITASMARKYSGAADPLGKTLKIDGEPNYLITGVVDDFPANTHLHMDFMASMESVPDSRATYWIKNNYFTYVVLKPGVSPDEFDRRLEYIIAKYFDPDLRKWVNFSLGDMAKNGNHLWFYLQRVSDIHLTPHDFEAERFGNRAQCLLLLWAAVGVLAFACLNSAGLLGSGIRTGTRLQVPRLVRTALVSAVAALAIAVAICPLLLPYVSHLRTDEVRLSLLKPWWILPAALPLAITLRLVAAGFGAALDRLSTLRSYRIWNAWALLQFFVAAGLIVGALAIARQVHYVASKDLGLSLDNTVVLKEMDELRTRMHPFKEQLRAHPSIVAASDSATLPGRQFRGKSHSLVLRSAAADLLTLWQITVDAGFADTYRLHLVEGRFFSADRPDDAQTAVINESAARMLGMKIGTVISEHSPGTPYVFRVIGIVRDFHYESMRHQIRPTVIKLLQYQPGRVGRFVSVRVQPGQLPRAMAHIAAVWKKYLPERRLEYMFAADDYDRLLAPDRISSRMLSAFAAIALLFAGWALIGAVQRRPLSVPQPAATLRSAIYVLIANIGAIPLGYWFARDWISGFYYRVEFGSWVIFATVLVTVCLTAVIVTFLRPRNAGAGPVESPVRHNLEPTAEVVSA